MKCAALCHISLHSSNLDPYDSVLGGVSDSVSSNISWTFRTRALGGDAFPPRIELFERAHVGQNVSLALPIEAPWDKTSIANARF